MYCRGVKENKSNITLVFLFVIISLMFYGSLQDANLLVLHFV
nr:MAG TPA: hypothetical protein [Caudoviricetes sp.]